MATYLVKYQPLNSTEEGRQATHRFGLQPYLDGSCRREPDLEPSHPSITALCRGHLFAPHLNPGDEVLYVTFKDFYGEPYKHRRLVALLKVLKRFESHTAAAQWYHSRGEKLPSNCMVPGTQPLPLNHTTRGAANCAPGCGSAAATLKQWNAHYEGRAACCPVFLVCTAVWKELTSPAILTDEAAFRILKNWDRIRSRLPIQLTPAELQALSALASARRPGR